MQNKYNNGKLGIICLDNFKNRGLEVCNNIIKNRDDVSLNDILIPAKLPRFSNGEGKVVLDESVRDKDIYILSDISNYSCTYKMYGKDHSMAPDEHYQDILRTISAIAGKAKRLTVFMPLLYSSRQHRRTARESLDCALALRQLENLGVNTIVTLDAHDPNVQNATPNGSFETIFPILSVPREEYRRTLSEKSISPNIAKKKRKTNS
jgi:ribose-phosphate pyrophosphokinase